MLKTRMLDCQIVDATPSSNPGPRARMASSCPAMTFTDSVFYDRRRKAPASIAGRLGREAQRPMSDSESDVPDEMALMSYFSLTHSSMRRVENQGSPALRQWSHRKHLLRSSTPDFRVKNLLSAVGSGRQDGALFFTSIYRQFYFYNSLVSY